MVLWLFHGTRERKPWETPRTGGGGGGGETWDV